MSRQTPTNRTDTGKYEPKATVRHKKIARSEKERLREMKQRLDKERHSARKAEAGRRSEIRKLPRGERGPATAQLKEDIRRRREEQAAAREEYWEAVEEHKRKGGGQPRPATAPRRGDRDAAAVEAIVVEETVVEEIVIEEFCLEDTGTVQTESGEDAADVSGDEVADTPADGPEDADGQ